MASRDLIAEERLLQFRDDENVCASPFERALAAELIEARARIAELEAERDQAKGAALTQIIRADGLNAVAENFRWEKTFQTDGWNRYGRMYDEADCAPRLPVEVLTVPRGGR